MAASRDVPVATLVSHLQKNQRATEFADIMEEVQEVLERIKHERLKYPPYGHVRRPTTTEEAEDFLLRFNRWESRERRQQRYREKQAKLLELERLEDEKVLSAIQTQKERAIEVRRLKLKAKDERRKLAEEKRTQKRNELELKKKRKQELERLYGSGLGYDNKGLRAGILYERHIKSQISRCMYDGRLITANESTAGPRSIPDITFYVAKGEEGESPAVNLECKTDGSTRGGTKSFLLVDDLTQPGRKKFVLPTSIHSEILAEINRVPFEGLIPQYRLNRSIRSLSDEEIVTFKDQRHEIRQTAVADYYKAKGVHYIQIQGKGLYTTGNDILKLGVPIFKCRQFMLFHARRRTPSVLSVLEYDYKSITASPFDLDDFNKLPPKLSRPPPTTFEKFVGAGQAVGRAFLSLFSR